MATGGTLQFLKAQGLKVISIEEWTNFPDRFGGRVKTLHPHIFAAILAKEGPDHLELLKQMGIERIALVAVNLYPFIEKAQEGLTREELVEYIDIGGPSLLRAAAKNSDAVIPVCDPADYPCVLEALRTKNDDTNFRRNLSAKVFRVTATYDAAIASIFSSGESEEIQDPLTVGGWKALDLRYGENPHQAGAYFTMTGRPGFETLQGKALSYNNLLDLTAAAEFASLFPTEPFCVIIKHTNPAGAALGETTTDAFIKALNVDSPAAFGGIIGFSQPVDENTAREIIKSFFEVVVAPDYDKGALALFGSRKNLRVIRAPSLKPPRTVFRSVMGGILCQWADDPLPDDPASWELVSGQPANDEVLRDLLFAWRLVAPTKSNAITVTRDGVLIGIGCGQTSRVRSVQYALLQAGDRSRGAVLASDAFFPFPDSVELAAAAGIRAVVAPKGSIRDAEIVTAARNLNLTLYFAPRRHFRH